MSESQLHLFPQEPSDVALLVVPGLGGPGERARSLNRAAPGRFVVTTRSAAALWSVDALPSGADPHTWPLELAVPAPLPVPLRPLSGSARYAHLPESDVCVLEGIRVTTLERTAVDCALTLPRYEALSVLDQCLDRGVTREALARRVRAAAGPGVAQARALVAMADAGAESPAESLVRGRLVDAGFPRPVCQVRALPSRYRLDLAQPEYRCAIEYSGEAHHTGRARRARDFRRGQVLEALGWRVLTVTREFRAAPAPYLDAWLDLLTRGGWSPPAAALTALTRRIDRLRRRRAA